MAWSTTTDPRRFDAAADWFLGRIAITKGWYEGLALKWRRHTFTAANLATLQMVAELQQSLLDAMNEGKHLRDWKREYLATLEAQWAGSVKDPGFRASTIYRNALQRSYNTGRWVVHTDPAVMAARPYWMFDAIIDGRETDICRERDGTILAADHPWWGANYPPLHHRCRSSVRALREAEAAKRGITTNPQLDTESQRGFGAAPNADEWNPDPSGMPGKLKDVWEKKQAGLTPVQPPLSPPPPPPGSPYNPATSPAPAPAVKSKPKAKAKPKPKAGDQPAVAGEPSGPQPLRDVILGEKRGDATGSNPGGIYRGTDGIDRYVKFYEDRAQAYGEHLANQVYKGLGHEAVESVVFELADGTYAYASTILDGAETLGSAGLTAARAKKALDGFAADVLTANWDAAGLSLDNLLVLKSGKLVRIDNGGTFLMRARYGRKPTQLLNALTEWEGFLDPAKNPAYARIAAKAGISDARQLGKGLIQQIDDILELQKAAGGWDAFVRMHAPGLMPADRKAIVSMLEARTTLLKAKRAEIQAFLKASKSAQARAATPPAALFDADDPAWARLNLRDRNRTVAAQMNAAAQAADRAAQADAIDVVRRWTSGYSNGRYQTSLRTQAKAVLAGKAPTTDTGRKLKRVLDTRAARWQAAAQAAGVDVPSSFRVYRGVRDGTGDFLQDVYEAWRDNATEFRVRAKEMASWSFNRQTAINFAGGGSQSVVYQADLPFAQTFADQLIDDSSFLSSFFGEHEVISITAQPNAIVGDPRAVTVRFGGRVYTWADRADFIRAWEAAHGPGGMKRAP